MFLVLVTTFSIYGYSIGTLYIAIILVTQQISIETWVRR